MAAVALAVQQAKAAKGAPRKRKRNADADADEAARRALVAEFISILSSPNAGCKELTQAMNIVQLLGTRATNPST